MKDPTGHEVSFESQFEPQNHALCNAEIERLDARIEELAEAVTDRGEVIDEQDKRIAELEECLFDGLTVTTAQKTRAWLKRAQALLKKGKE